MIRSTFFNCFISSSEDVVDVRFFKIRKADSTEFLNFIGFFKRFPCFTAAFEVSIFSTEFRPRLRAVDNHHVKIIEPYCFKRRINRYNSLFIRLYFRRKFGGNKQILSVYPTGSDTFSNTAFIRICLSRINVPVSFFYSILPGLARIFITYKPCSKTQFWDINSIGQRILFFQNHKWFLLFLASEPLLPLEESCSLS